MKSLQLTLGEATRADAAAIGLLQTRVADALTRQHGLGHWSSPVSEQNAVSGLVGARVLVAREVGSIVATVRLMTRKPWAIDAAYFTAVRHPLYLLSMAVDPDRQRQGIGRWLLDEATAVANTWPADAIRLDAYDSPAGAGAFYARCGFTEVGRTTYRQVPLLYFERLL